MMPNPARPPSRSLGRQAVMRVSILLVLVLVGCSRQDGREFDAFLATNRIDRIEIVYEDRDRTNVFTGAEATHLVGRLAATNRLPDPLYHKSYVSGYVWLCSGRERLGGLAYFSREQVLSYRGYEFSFRDTNDISTLFR